MCAYQLASRAPAACLKQNARRQTPIALAAASEKGEVGRAMGLVATSCFWRRFTCPTASTLGCKRQARTWPGCLLLVTKVPTLYCPEQVLNAMLLACSGHTTPEALEAMRSLLQAGAVCDTWCACAFAWLPCFTIARCK